MRLPPTERSHLQVRMGGALKSPCGACAGVSRRGLALMHHMFTVQAPLPRSG